MPLLKKAKHLTRQLMPINMDTHRRTAEERSRVLVDSLIKGRKK